MRPQWVEVDVKRVRVENRRDFGGPWLGLQLVEQLGLKDFLDRTIPSGREEIPWSLMALVLVLCRLCNPSSELHIAEHFYAQSALSDLLGIAPEKINEQLEQPSDRRSASPDFIQQALDRGVELIARFVVARRNLLPDRFDAVFAHLGQLLDLFGHPRGVGDVDFVGDLGGFRRGRGLRGSRAVRRTDRLGAV